MMFARTVAVVLCAVTGQGASASDSARMLNARDPAQLEAAAIAIAESGDASGLAILADRLGQKAFLSRLDPRSGSEADVTHVAHVFRALAEHPRPATAELCVTLARNPSFTAVPARINLLLNALAAVRPVSQAAAEIFRQTNSSGFVEVNGPLLARNGSPRALGILAQILSDEKVEVAQRVSIAHFSLLPTRTNSDIVEMSARVLQSEALAPDVTVAILESLFDYQPRRWFGVSGSQPEKPAWSAASPAARAALQALGKRALGRSDLPTELRAAIVKTLAELS